MNFYQNPESIWKISSLPEIDQALREVEGYIKELKAGASEKERPAKRIKRIGKQWKHIEENFQNQRKKIISIDSQEKFGEDQNREDNTRFRQARLQGGSSTESQEIRQGKWRDCDSEEALEAAILEIAELSQDEAKRAVIFL
jgi:hypothetical protein